MASNQTAGRNHKYTVKLLTELFFNDCLWKLCKTWMQIYCRGSLFFAIFKNSIVLLADEIMTFNNLISLCLPVQSFVHIQHYFQQHRLGNLKWNKPYKREPLFLNKNISIHLLGFSCFFSKSDQDRILTVSRFTLTACLSCWWQAGRRQAQK